MEQILEKLKQFEKFKEDLTEEVKNFVQNKDINLEIRWNIFVTSKLGKHDGFYHNPDGINWNKLTLFDDFYIDKYQLINAESFVEICKDMIEDKEEDKEEDIDINKVKEYFINNFIYSFENDW